MKASIELLLTENDERALSLLLRVALPQVTFFDKDAWDEPDLKTWDSIHKCRTMHTFIWNRPSVLAGARPLDHLNLRWPTSRPAISLLRPRLDGSLLRAGNMSAGVDNNDPARDVMANFIESVWKISKQFAKGRADFVNPVTREITTPRAYNTIVGPDATAWCLADDNRFFKNYSGNFFLRPSAQLESGKAAKRRRK